MTLQRERDLAAIVNTRQETTTPRTPVDPTEGVGSTQRQSQLRERGKTIQSLGQDGLVGRRRSTSRNKKTPGQ